ncbi:unnamed protein product, partial [Urochloa humidicola]
IPSRLPPSRPPSSLRTSDPPDASSLHLSQIRSHGTLQSRSARLLPLRPLLPCEWRTACSQPLLSPASDATRGGSPPSVGLCEPSCRWRKAAVHPTSFDDCGHMLSRVEEVMTLGVLQAEIEEQEAATAVAGSSASLRWWRRVQAGARVLAPRVQAMELLRGCSLLLHCGSDPAIPGASLFFGDASHSDSWVGIRMLDRVLTYRSGEYTHAQTMNVEPWFYISTTWHDGRNNFTPYCLKHHLNLLPLC